MYTSKKTGQDRKNTQREESGMQGKTTAIRLIIVLLCAALLLGGIHYFTQEYQI